MGAPRKYTRAILAAAAERSSSIAEVMRNLGILKWTGGQHNLIRYRLEEYGIDTSHFLGRSAGRGDRHRGGPDKKPWREVLILRKNGLRAKAFRLRRALIEAGVPYHCAGCNSNPTWRWKPLRLEVEHKNGNFLDCRKNNLEFLCPNCHSQKVEVLTGTTSEAELLRDIRVRRRGETLVDPQR